MKIFILDNNGETTKEIEITAEKFAYDGCHKIFTLDNERDIKEALSYNYEIHPIADLEKTFVKSCPLRFISRWDLKETYIEQFEVENLGNVYFEDNIFHISWYNKNGSLMKRKGIKDLTFLDYEIMCFVQEIKFELALGDKICIEGVEK